jgi:hypothetical protein
MGLQKHNPVVVTAFFQEQGLPIPSFEFKFHLYRKWRFDIAFPEFFVYIEVNGGIWIAGGHNRGAQMIKDWEKYNAATELGWRPLFCQPKDVCTTAFAEQIKRSLGIEV